MAFDWRCQARRDARRPRTRVGTVSRALQCRTLFGLGSQGYSLLCGSLIDRFVDVEDLVEAGDLEDAQDAHARSDESEVPFHLAQALEPADQHAKSRAVQIFD